MVLATQNPVDLDYKALSNTGTWFLGRLQTERDKARLLDGLEGVGATGKSGMARAELDRLLSSLDKRVFLLHNVHDERPVLFHTRWTMSYLRGPLDREEIGRLKGNEPAFARDASDAGFGEAGAVIPTDPGSPKPAAGPRAGEGVGSPPVLDPSIQQFFVPSTGPGSPKPAAGASAGEGGSAYSPALVGAVRVAYSDAKLGVDEVHDVLVSAPIGEARYRLIGIWRNQPRLRSKICDRRRRADSGSIRFRQRRHSQRSMPSGKRTSAAGLRNRRAWSFFAARAPG